MEAFVIVGGERRGSQLAEEINKYGIDAVVFEHPPEEDEALREAICTACNTSTKTLTVIHFISHIPFAIALAKQLYEKAPRAFIHGFFDGTVEEGKPLEKSKYFHELDCVQHWSAVAVMEVVVREYFADIELPVGDSVASPTSALTEVPGGEEKSGADPTDAAKESLPPIEGEVGVVASVENFKELPISARVLFVQGRMKAHDYMMTRVAEELDIDRPSVVDLFALCTLPDAVRDLLDRGLSIAKALCLLDLLPDAATTAAQSIVSQSMTSRAVVKRFGRPKVSMAAIMQRLGIPWTNVRSARRSPLQPAKKAKDSVQIDDTNTSGQTGGETGDTVPAAILKTSEGDLCTGDIQVTDLMVATVELTRIVGDIVINPEPFDTALFRRSYGEVKDLCEKLRRLALELEDLANKL